MFLRLSWQSYQLEQATHTHTPTYIVDTCAHIHTCLHTLRIVLALVRACTHMYPHSHSADPHLLQRRKNRNRSLRVHVSMSHPVHYVTTASRLFFIEGCSSLKPVIIVLLSTLRLTCWAEFRYFCYLWLYLFHCLLKAAGSVLFIDACSIVCWQAWGVWCS